MNPLDWMKDAATTLLARYWARRDPAPPNVEVYGTQPSSALQRMMNLVMPLKDDNPATKALAASTLFFATDEIFTGLDNVGTVHNARFLIIGDAICMCSVYDGDFANYIRDFIGTIGSVFDAVTTLVKDPPPAPAARRPEEFIDWAHAHDAFQLPDSIAELADDLKDPRDLERKMLVILQTYPNVQLGRYLRYPGFSAGQVRERLGIGW